LRSSALELTLQNFVNLCNQRSPGGIRNQNARNSFCAGDQPRTPLGELTTLPRPLSRMGREIPLSIPLPRRLRRLDLSAFGACWFAPSFFLFSRARITQSVANYPQKCYLYCSRCALCV